MAGTEYFGYLAAASRVSDSDISLPPEIAFLDGNLADRASLQRITGLAREWGVSAEQVLLATGLVEPESYYRALASHAGLDFSDLAKHAADWTHYRHVHRRAAILGDVAPLGTGRNGIQIAHAPSGSHARRIARLSDEPMLSYRLRENILLTTPARIRRAYLQQFGEAIGRDAIGQLERQSPGSSAFGGLVAWQKIALAALPAVGTICLLFALWPTLYFANFILASVFFCVTLLRAIAGFRAIIAPASAIERPRPNDDRELPVYTILVPLFREAEVLPDLVRALKRIDYPAAKLDIKLILEEEDSETRAVAAVLGLPASFDIVVVPALGPQTKPKALNYALRFARGAYAVIYDAEDRPEPDQLRRALEAFEAGPPDLACLQARLSVYNIWQNWLTRQFTIEYAGLFDVLLPTLEFLNVPIPLGGTSNHFKMEILRDVGAWDSHNVTEDADLGIRLARRGYRCKMLDSTTYEEACPQFRSWRSQRTRWFKGWMQTLAVHTRQPVKTWRQLGTRGMAALLIVVGGILLTALAYPLFVVLIVYALFQESLFGYLPEIWSEVFLLGNLWNLTAGLIASVALGWFGIRSRHLNGGGAYGLTRDLFGVPVYWLLISLAAYRAIWQVATNPYHWEKTTHGLYRSHLWPELDADRTRL